MNKADKRYLILRIISVVVFLSATVGLLDFIPSYQSEVNNFLDGFILGYLFIRIVFHFLRKKNKAVIFLDINVSIFFIFKILSIGFLFVFQSYNLPSWHYVLLLLISFMAYLPITIDVFGTVMNGF